MTQFKPGQSGNPKGRPKRSEKHAGAIAKAEKRIADRLPELIDRLFELADGVLVEERVDGRPIVYQRPPDFKAASYLADRIMGKPTERKEVSGPNGAPVGVEFYSYDALASEVETGSE